MLCVRRPSVGITSAISQFSAAAERASAPGAGAALSISDDERRRILEEEQRQLDILKVIYIDCPVHCL